MSKRGGGKQKRRPDPIRKDDYGGRAANIAGFVVMGVFTGIALLSVFGIRIPVPSIPLPEQLDSTPARLILGFVGLFLAIIIGALFYKQWEVRKAAAWPSVRGRITRSRHGVRTTTADDGASTSREIADIEFQYDVAGTLYAGNRPTLAEVLTPLEISEMVARYPVGETVIVHYNPADPADSVLERDGLPPDSLRGCLIALALCVAGTLFVMRIVTEGPDFMYPYFQVALPDADFPLMFFLLVFAAGFGGPAFIWGRLVLKVKRWATTPAVVLSTSVQLKSGGAGSARSYIPVIRYRYSVGGVQKIKDTFSHGVMMGGHHGWAEKIVARYPVGATIDIRYNPENPDETSIRTELGFIGWALVALASAFLLGAMAAAGLF